MLDDVQRRWNRWRRSLDENHDFMTHDDIGSTKSLTFASTASSKFRSTKTMTFALDKLLDLQKALLLNFACNLC